MKKFSIQNEDGLYFFSELVLRNIKGIGQLYKKPISELRKLNDENGRLYNGRELTKEQLIYQLTFLADAPDNE